MIDEEVKKTFIKSGVLGLVLAWALWQNQILVSRVLDISERTVLAISDVTREVKELRNDLLANKKKGRKNEVD